MYLKRYLELFIVYAISIIVAMFICGAPFTAANAWLIIIGIIVGYLVLTIPLTLLTMRKNTVHEEATGSQKSNSTFDDVLQQLPGNIVLATANKDGIISNSFVTYVQSQREENILYVVTDPKSNRVQNIEMHPQVAFCTLFNQKTGVRLSSNNADATVTTGADEIKELVNKEPKIKHLDRDGHLSDKAVLTITVSSALIESFREPPKTVNFA